MLIDRVALKALREAKGMSQSEFASRIGITQAHVSKIELGHADTTTEILVAMATVLSVPPEDLLLKNPTRTPPVRRGRARATEAA